jgi:RNA polymerase sigma-70 factor (ECF subfamily)
VSDFDSLYAAHADAVFRCAMRWVSRRDIAEDIVSESFLALYQNLDRIDTSQLPAWLLTVARNRATDYWRRKAVEERYVSTLAAPPPARSSDADWLFKSELLKPSHRVCLMLRYVHGMSRAEIAKRTGLSSDQVKNRLQYALRVLRDHLMACPEGRTDARVD